MTAPRTHDGRIAALEARLVRPAPADASAPDLGRLTAAERDELGQLVVRCRPGEGPYPGSDPRGLWALTDEELHRATVLVHRALGRPLPPGW